MYSSYSKVGFSKKYMLDGFLILNLIKFFKEFILQFKELSLILVK